MRETSWFLPRSTRFRGPYFKFAGDLQESSSRGKSWGFRMLFDRSPRSIQKIVTLRNRASDDAWSASMQNPSFLILFLLLLPFLFSSLPFILFLFRVVFVSQIIDRAIRDAHASETKSEGREREMVLRLKEVATDVEVTTSVCQRRLTIRIFRYFYRSNVLLRQYCSSSFLFCLFLNDLPRYIYISFNSLLALIRCSRGISQAASILRDYDSNPRLIIAQTLG